MTVIWDITPCSPVKTDRRFRGAYCLRYQHIELTVKAINTSETFYEPTLGNIPEDSHRHALRCQNTKSHSKPFLPWQTRMWIRKCDRSQLGNLSLCWIFKEKYFISSQIHHLALGLSRPANTPVVLVWKRETKTDSRLRRNIASHRASGGALHPIHITVNEASSLASTHHNVV
jgi:hypothetical protein